MGNSNDSWTVMFACLEVSMPLGMQLVFIHGSSRRQTVL